MISFLQRVLFDSIMITLVYWIGGAFTTIVFG